METHYHFVSCVIVPVYTNITQRVNAYNSSFIVPTECNCSDCGTQMMTTDCSDMTFLVISTPKRNMRSLEKSRILKDKCLVTGVLWKQTTILSHVFILFWTNIAQRGINVSVENDI